MKPKTLLSSSISNGAAVESSSHGIRAVPPGVPRRSFLRRLGMGAVLLSPAAALLTSTSRAEEDGNDIESENSLTKGDAALLRFAAAAEIIETDFWVQYNELAGIQDSEVPDGTGNQPYHDAVAQLDSDMDQYIHDNTEDERTHFTFLNAYLASKGSQGV